MTNGNNDWKDEVNDRLDEIDQQVDDARDDGSLTDDEHSGCERENAKGQGSPGRGKHC